MSCATCAKNEICLINQDTLNNPRHKCPNELPKSCEVCNKEAHCSRARKGGYCREFHSKFSKTVLFGS